MLRHPTRSRERRPLVARNALCVLLFLGAVGASAQVLWKPDKICFELKQWRVTDRGLILELNQELEPGESGWKQSRIDVLEDWAEATVAMKDDAVEIVVHGKKYRVDGENKGKLSGAILKAGTVSDRKLAELWAKFAGVDG